jgi:hypothetical protein
MTVNIFVLLLNLDFGQKEVFADVVREQKKCVTYLAQSKSKLV